MKLRVERDVLADSVAWAARTLPSRPSLPVLAGLVLTATEGGLRWTLTVSPGSTDVLAWHYRLELPAKSEVIGGNRRD